MIDELTTTEDIVHEGNILRPTLTVFRNRVPGYGYGIARAGDSGGSPIGHIGTDMVIEHRMIIPLDGQQGAEVSQLKAKSDKTVNMKGIGPDYAKLLVPAVHVIDENGDDVP